MPYFVQRSAFSVQSKKSKNYELTNELTLNHRGFTLIELLTALGIVVVVFGVIITSSAGIQRSSRNTQRKADLANIKSALQHYYADQNFYPDNNFIINPASGSFSSDLSSSDGNFAPLPNPVKTYLSNIPKDPTPSNLAYCYIGKNLAGTTCTSNDPAVESDPANRCHKYSLYAKLEDSSLTNLPAISCGGGSNLIYNYQVDSI